MKELYTKPESKIDTFKTVDVMTTSVGDDGIDDGDGGEFE